MAVPVFEIRDCLNLPSLNRRKSDGVELYPTLEAKAAAYCFSIVMNHPFVDGNKRTGFVAADTFLRINGSFVNVDPKSVRKQF